MFASVSQSRLHSFALLLTLIAASTFCGRWAEAVESAQPIHQLRIYEIFDRNKQAFHDRFRDHAARIMRKYDFNIVAMWESSTGDRTQFVYLLEWPDEATMKERWAKFMADEEWAAIKKRTGAIHSRFVGSIQDRTLKLTDYSPQRRLLSNQ